MKRFDTHVLFYIAIYCFAMIRRQSDSDGIMPDKEREMFLHFVEWWPDELTAMGLPMSAMSAQMLKGHLQAKSAASAVSFTAQDLSNRLTDELDIALFFAIPQGKQYLVSTNNPFGTDVAQRFPAAAIDIDEASKCLAFERYTAAVYHLMRVAESAVILICKRIGYNSPKPGFGDALKFLDNGLQKVRDHYNDANPLFKGDVEFLSAVAAHMHAVNEAWRQRVSHIERNYNEEEAMSIFNATKGLMQHLAKKLTEDNSD